MSQEEIYNSTKHIADLIVPSISKMDLEEDVLSGRLIKNWENIVGATLAKNVRFFRLKKKEIVLLTNSSTWRFELFARREEIINSCNQYLGFKAVETMKIR